MAQVSATGLCLGERSAGSMPPHADAHRSARKRM